VGALEQVEDEAGDGGAAVEEPPQLRCRFVLEMLDGDQGRAEKTVMRVAWIRRTRAGSAVPPSAFTPAT
jgi:hypothetical protein